MPEEIEIRSDEVQEILTSVPNWMIRWGITLIFGIILGLLTLSYFIKYPDVISGQVTLTTEVPPSKLVAGTSGKLESIEVEDMQEVEKGDIIAQIRNPLTKEAVVYLEKVVADVEEGLSTDFDQPIIFDDNQYVFGAVQLYYSQLVEKVDELQFILKQQQYEKRRSILQKQIANHRKLSTINDQQLIYSQELLGTAKEKYESNKKLYEQGVISKLEYFEFKDTYSRIKSEIENSKKSSVQNVITLTDYERQLTELEITFTTQKMGLASSIENLAGSIRNELSNWRENFILKAPFSGTVSFIDRLAENQFVEMGKPLFAVIPNVDQKYLGYVRVSQLGYGKIKVGQEVKMKFNNFPANEYGQVLGRVDQISAIPNEEEYLVKVSLQDGLHTTYKKELIYSPELAGSADIITEDLRIIERVFNQFRELFDQ